MMEYLKRLIFKLRRFFQNRTLSQVHLAAPAQPDTLGLSHIAPFLLTLEIPLLDKSNSQDLIRGFPPKLPPFIPPPDSTEFTQLAERLQYNIAHYVPVTMEVERYEDELLEVKEKWQELSRYAAIYDQMDKGMGKTNLFLALLMIEATCGTNLIMHMKQLAQFIETRLKS